MQKNKDIFNLSESENEENFPSFSEAQDSKEILGGCSEKSNSDDDYDIQSNWQSLEKSLPRAQLLTLPHTNSYSRLDLLELQKKNSLSLAANMNMKKHDQMTEEKRRDQSNIVPGGEFSRNKQAFMEPQHQKQNQKVKEDHLASKQSQHVFSKQEFDLIFCENREKEPKNNNKVKNINKNFMNHFLNSPIFQKLDEDIKTAVLQKFLRQKNYHSKKKNQDKNAGHNLYILQRLFGLDLEKSDARDHIVNFHVRKIFNQIVQDYILFDTINSHRMGQQNRKEYLIMYKVFLSRLRSHHLINRLQDK